MFQFEPDSDSNYITIYDVNDDENSTMITNLTGPDVGPYVNMRIWPSGFSRWQKKIISSSSNNMWIEFKAAGVSKYVIFSASIQYSPLPSKECEKGLDMTRKIIQSPNYPDLYYNNLSCKWLITVSHGLHLTLKFTIFDVSFFKYIVI